MPNPGHQPSETAGKRVRVELANGMRPDGGWPAGPPTRWTLTGHPFDIARFEVIG